MDKDSLYKLMEANGLISGTLLCHLGFSGVSGSTFFNEAHEVSGQNWMSGHFLDWPSSSKLDSDKFAAISINDNNLKNSSTNLDGSGYLKGNDVLSIGTGIGTGSWSAFISISGEITDDIKGLSNVILSTSSKPNDTSGFFLGRNSRSLFVENYDNTNSRQNIYTHDKELLNKSIISISKNQLDEVSVSVHDPINSNISHTEIFVMKGYADSDQLTIGGFSSNQNEILNYTGFSGYFDEFLLITGALGEEDRVDVAKSFYASSYSKPEYINQETSYTALSGSVLVTGVIDTGITGYENVVVDTIGGIDLYASSGVEGEITGSFYSGVEGTGTQVVVETVFNDESFSYNNSDLKSYSTPVVSFKNNLAASDIYEVYSQNQKSDSIGLVAKYIKSNKTFLTDDSFSGIDTENKIGLVYANGYLIESGNSNTGMYTRVNDFSLSVSGYSGLDTVTYDTLPNYSGGQIQYEVNSVQSTGIRFTDEQYLNKDVYFEGRKLLSGQHWSGGSSEGFVDVLDSSFGGVSQVDAGTLIFVPVSDSFFRITGEGQNSIDTNINLINEQIWVNGRRKQRDKDYFLISSGSNLNSTSRQNPVENILYSGQTGFYNV